MKTNFIFNGIEFEWDNNKASANIAKHGVAFETACEVFFDPFLRVEDAGIVEGEPREAVIGLTMGWRLLYAIYTMREDDVIRIVSARPVTESERKSYEDQ